MKSSFSAFLFMAKSPFAKSQRKFIRKEKARIRREFWNSKKQEEEIQKLYEKVSGKPKVAEIKEQGKIKEEKK